MWNSFVSEFSIEIVTNKNFANLPDNVLTGVGACLKELPRVLVGFAVLPASATTMAKSKAFALMTVITSIFLFAMVHQRISMMVRVTGALSSIADVLAETPGGDARVEKEA